MRVTKLSLTNFKPYATAEIDLRDGVTVIHGVNGSGKSSLLEAVFFALYGSKALEGTLDDVVTNGTETCEIDLIFTHQGETYELIRELKRSGERVSTRKCVLTGPDVTIEGARDVRTFVTELLRMDAEAFINCAYVQQGDVNKLINATPKQRQDMIDDLLQLGVLEEYRTRAGQARLGVEDVLGNTEGALQNIRNQIKTKEDTEPYARLNNVENELSDVTTRIENYEGEKQKAEKARDAAESTLSEYEEKQQRVASLTESIDSIQNQIESTAAERSTLKEQSTEHRAQIQQLSAQADRLRESLSKEVPTANIIEEYEQKLIEDLDEIREKREELRIKQSAYKNQANALSEKATHLSERAETTETEIETLQEEIQSVTDQIKEQKERLETLKTERQSLSSRFDAAPIDSGSASSYVKEIQTQKEEQTTRKAELSATIESLTDTIEETEHLLAEGKCPECGQPVEGSPHVHDLSDDRERLSEYQTKKAAVEEKVSSLTTELAEAQKLVETESRIDEIETTITLLTERIDELAERRSQKENQLNTKQDAIAEYRSQAESVSADAQTKQDQHAEVTAEISAFTDELSEIESERDQLTELSEITERQTELEERIERLTEKRSELQSRNDERREWLKQQRDERESLKEAVDERAIESAKEQKSNAEQYLEQVTEMLTQLTTKRDRLTSERGEITAEIEQLESLNKQQTQLQQRVDALSALRSETSDLESMYGEIRATLRQQNVETLERMVNEMFDLIYANDAYSHIELDGEYELSVFQKDGERLDPEQLSGGERALFNLSLRCAIYRLLAEGIDGAAPTPPLILDEPTVFLDTGHVDRLVQLVSEMRGFGVDQILIVSHDDKLIDAADDLVTVEKNPTTNRSTVNRADKPALSALQVQVGDD